MSKNAKKLDLSRDREFLLDPSKWGGRDVIHVKSHGIEPREFGLVTKGDRLSVLLLAFDTDTCTMNVRGEEHFKSIDDMLKKWMVD